MQKTLKINRTGLNRGISLALLAALVLSGCATMLNFTPERAVVQEILSPGWGGVQVDPDSVQVLQTQMLGETALVLVQFEGLRTETGQQDTCLHLFAATKSKQGWLSRGGGGGCSPAGGTQPAEAGLSVSMGQHTGGDLNYSEVDGLVFAPDIESVKVTWADGETQDVEVVNGSYLALRPGGHQLKRLEGLDSTGEVVYTYEEPGLPPGKREMVVPEEEG